MIPAKKLSSESKNTIKDGQESRTGTKNTLTQNIVKLLILLILYYVIIFM
jgi:hypothetical protein